MTLVLNDHLKRQINIRLTAERDRQKAENLLGMDRVYQALSSFCRSTKYTEEMREHEGTTYSAEVYPEGKYNAETTFFYDTDGKLVFIEVKAFTTESGTEIPASFYTINAIDTNVDESVFDTSAYTIKEG